MNEIFDQIQKVRLESKIKKLIEEFELETEDLKNLFIEIKKIKNDEIQLELFDIFVNNVKEAFSDWELTEEDAYANVLEVRNNLRTYGELSDVQIDELFAKNDFNVESITNTNSKTVVDNESFVNVVEANDNDVENTIVSNSKDVEPVIEVVEDPTVIKKIDAINSKDVEPIVEVVDEPKVIEKIDTVNSKDVEPVIEVVNDHEIVENREIEKINFRISKLRYELGLDKDISIEEIDEQIKLLEEENLKNISYENLLLEDKNRKISNVDENFNQEEVNKVQQELDEKRKELDVYQQELEEKGVSYTDQCMDEKYIRLVNEIGELENKINKLNNNETYELSLPLLEDKGKVVSNDVDKINQEEVNKVQQELDEKRKELDVYQQELEEKGISYTDQCMDEKYIRLVNEIGELENKINKLNNNEFYEISLPLLEDKQKSTNVDKQLNSKTVEKIAKLKELKKLKIIRDAYTKIQSDAITKYENENLENEIDLVINDFVNNHRLVKELDKYENADLLKQQLKEDIKNGLKTKKVTKKEENKKLLYKGLAAVAGFGLGLAFSSAPGVGTIRMGIATTKLAVSAINVWSNKHPDGKIAKIKNTVVDKVNDINPELVEKLKQMRENLKKSPLNCFINGVAAGYVVGNVVQLVTGESVLGHLTGDKTNVQVNSPSKGTGIIDANNTNAVFDAVDETMDTIPVRASEIVLREGEVVDLSSLSRGLVSSDATDAVKLMQSVGKEVTFDKAVKLPNGKVMWHFKQMNGLGYAWFNAEDVQELLAKAADVSSKTL